MSLREELQRIYDQRGELTPRLVVELAHNPDDWPALHNHLEWDDTVAGEAHRRNQAARLIRSFKIVDRSNPARPRHIREYVSVTRADASPTYMPVADAFADEFIGQLALQAMQRDIAALKRKYGHMKEFRAAILAAIQEESA